MTFFWGQLYYLMCFDSHGERGVMYTKLGNNLKYNRIQIHIQHDL